MVIVCASHVATGKVIMVLLAEGLLPISHFCVEQRDYDPDQVIVTVNIQLSAQPASRLRRAILAIPDTSMQ